MTREELLKIAKPMIVNLEVAKTIPNKTQTRRLLNPQPKLVIKAENERHNSYSWKGGMYALDMYPNNSLIIEKASKRKVGDILWVREPVRVTHFLKTGSSSEGDYQEKMWFKYLADDIEDCIDVPERFGNTPKWITNCQGIPNGCLKEMARTFLRVTNVRVEQLQDISDEDCISEGIFNVSKDGEIFKYCIYDKKDYSSVPWQDMPRNPQDVYKILWNKTAPKGYKWEDNPYVFVYEFEKVEALR